MRERNWFEKGIILVLIVMAVVFAFVYHHIIRQEGFAYMGALLLPSQADGATLYSGTVDDKEAVFTITADKQVTFRLGDTVYGPYTVKEDPTAIAKDHKYAQYMTGLEIKKGDEIFFRGAYMDRGNDIPRQFYNEKGEAVSVNVKVHVTGGGIVKDEHGNVIDPMEPTVGDILSLIRGPKLIHRGNWVIYFLCLFTSAMAVILVLFGEQLTRWRMRYYYRNADELEFTEGVYVARYIAFVILVVAIFGFYIRGLS